MADLTSIPEIGKASRELLEAAGFDDIDSLARAGVGELANELERANSILKITKRAPNPSIVGKWIETAREVAGIEDVVEEEVSEPVDYEQAPKVASLLGSAPFAIPLPARVMVENKLAVSDIPPAILLNHYSGDLELRTERIAPKTRPAKTAVSAGFVRMSDGGGSERLEIDTSKVRTMDAMPEPLAKVAAVKTSPSNDRLALLRAPRSSTNKGRSPDSRWYIRGVLHSHPVSLYFGAAVTLLLMIMVPLALVSTALLMLSDGQVEMFEWVPAWLLVFPVILPLLGIAYLIWGITGSCRICGMKLFVHRAHRKNIKAHRVPGLGYILPLCFQILIFRWFRCTHCGTPVRLKE